MPSNQSQSSDSGNYEFLAALFSAVVTAIGMGVITHSCVAVHDHKDRIEALEEAIKHRECTP